MLEWKARLPEHLYMPAVDKASSRKSYPVKLATKMNTAHEKLRAQHLQLWTEDRQEAPSFKVKQQV